MGHALEGVRQGLVVGACVGVVLLLLPLAKVGHERWRQAVQDAEDAAHHAFLSLQEDVRPTASAASVLRRLQAAELAAGLPPPPASQPSPLPQAHPESLNILWYTFLPGTLICGPFST